MRWFLLFSFVLIVFWRTICWVQSSFNFSFFSTGSVLSILIWSLSASSFSFTSSLVNSSSSFLISFCFSSCIISILLGYKIDHQVLHIVLCRVPFWLIRSRLALSVRIISWKLLSDFACLQRNYYKQHVFFSESLFCFLSLEHCIHCDISVLLCDGDLLLLLLWLCWFFALCHYHQQKHAQNDSKNYFQPFHFQRRTTKSNQLFFFRFFFLLAIGTGFSIYFSSVLIYQSFE